MDESVAGLYVDTALRRVKSMTDPETPSGSTGAGGGATLGEVICEVRGVCVGGVHDSPLPLKRRCVLCVRAEFVCLYLYCDPSSTQPPEGHGPWTRVHQSGVGHDGVEGPSFEEVCSTRGPPVPRSLRSLPVRDDGTPTTGVETTFHTGCGPDVRIYPAGKQREQLPTDHRGRLGFMERRKGRGVKEVP